MNIRLLAPQELQLYDSFVESFEGSLVYYARPFHAFLAEAAGGSCHYLAAFDGDEIQGVLPYFVKEHPEYGKVLNSLPWYGSYGGALYRSSEALRVLLSEYSRLLSAPDVLSGTLIANPMSFDESVESCYKQQVPADYVDDRICQVSNLPEFTTEEALLSGFKQKTRNLVRKSLQQGFALRLADDDAAWDFLHAVHQENMAAIGGRAKPKSHFDALRRHIPKEWRKLFIAEKNGAPVAALLNLYYKKTVEYISPVIKQEHRAAQPLSFLIWHAMADAARNGYRRWVWGGTWKTQSSLHHFKAGWGAKDHPYCYLVRARAESRDRIKQDRDKILGAFAYYYVIPFQALEGA